MDKSVAGQNYAMPLSDRHCHFYCQKLGMLEPAITSYHVQPMSWPPLRPAFRDVRPTHANGVLGTLAIQGCVTKMS